MKKLSVLLGSIFAISLLAGCNNQSLNQFPIEQVAQNQQVTAMSEQGLVQLNRYIGKFYFEGLDTNNDEVITPVEYSKFNIADNAERFKKVDKNSDKKITVDEMMANRKNFLPDLFNKDNLRGMARISFKALDTDKDSVVSREEYYKQATSSPAPAPNTRKNSKAQAPDPQTIQILNIIFNLSDINRDDELGFSEFEDSIYAGIKGNPYLNHPATTTDANTPADPSFADPFKGQPASGNYSKPIIPDDNEE